MPLIEKSPLLYVIVILTHRDKIITLCSLLFCLFLYFSVFHMTAPRIPADKRIFTTSHTPNCLFQEIDERFAFCLKLSHIFTSHVSFEQLHKPPPLSFAGQCRYLVTCLRTWLGNRCLFTCIQKTDSLWLPFTRKVSRSF